MNFLRVRLLAVGVYDLTFRLEGATKANSGMIQLSASGQVETFSPGPHGGSAPKFTRESMEALFNWTPPEGLQIDVGEEYDYPT